MARGKKVNIEEYLANIKEYLEVGCSLHEACLHGLIPYRTMKQYYDEDDNVRKKVDRLQNTPILMARTCVVTDMASNSDLALKYLERKKKDEFSLRHETTGADGKDLQVQVVNYGDNTDSE